MTAVELAQLETFLEEQGILWKGLDRKERSVVVREWACIYGNAFHRGMRYKEGNKAQHAVGQMPAGAFLLLSITNESPLWKSSENGPQQGYRCGPAVIPDLSRFHNLDFAMAASDFSWTMVYTHEDDALGGPYFAERDWVTQSSIDGARERRERRRTKHRFE